jgi:hypothetical protein
MSRDEEQRKIREMRVKEEIRKQITIGYNESTTLHFLEWPTKLVASFLFSGRQVQKPSIYEFLVN